jgi:hypothetical protein
MRRLVSAGALVGPSVAGLAGCYWLASYQDLTSGLGKADAYADGGVEAAPAPEAGPFCPADAGALVYCMDFDDVDADTLGLQTYQAEAAIVTGVYVSPPSSLFVELHGPDSGTSGSYSVSFPFTPKTARLEFQVKSTVLGQWVTTLGIALNQDTTQTYRVLQVLVAPDGEFEVQEYVSTPNSGTPYGHATFALDGGLPADAWHHVILTMTVDDSTGQYFSGLTVDGQVLEDHQPLQASWAQGSAQLGVGSTWCRTGGPQFYYDNVRADFGL